MRASCDSAIQTMQMVEFTGPSIFQLFSFLGSPGRRLAVTTGIFLACGAWRYYTTRLKHFPRWVPGVGFLPMRGLLEGLPNVLPGSLDNSVARTPARVGRVYGPGGRYCTVTSAVSVQRLRRRARWVRALESFLGGRRGVVGSFLHGRWFPDLPVPARGSSADYCLASFENGARCLGGGIIPGRARPGKGRFDDVTYLCMDFGDEACLVVPDLLAKLRQYAVFRRRDELLLGSLRTRAVEWCKSAGLTPCVADLAVTGAVALAMEISTHERDSHLRVARAIRTPPPPHTLE